MLSTQRDGECSMAQIDRTIAYGFALFRFTGCAGLSALHTATSTMAAGECERRNAIVSIV